MSKRKGIVPGHGSDMITKKKIVITEEGRRRRSKKKSSKCLDEKLEKAVKETNQDPRYLNS